MMRRTIHDNHTHQRDALGQPRAGVAPRTGRRLHSWVRNALAFFVAMVALALLLEIGLRLALRSNDAQALVYPRRATAINGFGSGDFPQRTPEGELRILLLGASAFVTGDFPARFERLLNDSQQARQWGKRVRVVSTGVAAHMTFDSLWKYRDWYEGYDFDLVVVYHGINDVRANCYPTHLFRSDYAHMPYFQQYAQVFHWMERQPALARSFVITWVYKLVVRASVQMAPAFQRRAPYNDPRNDPWLPEGADVKTGPTFERNVEAIVELAHTRGQKLLLLTYAWYLPDDYTNARFRTRQLDYSFTEDSVPVEVWGLPENVALALDVHNASVRRVASRHATSGDEVHFFDMERAIPKDGAHFIDVCHWTDRGVAEFTRGVEAVVREIFFRPASPPPVDSAAGSAIGR